MKLYKLNNGALQSAPNSMIIDGRLHFPVSNEALIAQGYKPLTTAEKPPIEWFEKHVVSYSESEVRINEIVAIAPIDNLKKRFIDKINKECDLKIVSGFVFTDADDIEHPVWLSMENQFNYLNCEVPCELKLGEEDWLDLTDPKELERFKKECKKYISDTLKDCWIPKKAIKGFDDLQTYDYLKNK